MKTARAIRNPAPALGLQDVELAFVDSREVLDAARRAGLPSSAELRSVAPALLLAGSASPAEPAGVILHDTLGEAIHQCSLDLYAGCHLDTAIKGHGIVLAQRVLRVGGLVLNAMTLRAGDAGRRVAVLLPAKEGLPYAVAQRPHWERLLRQVAHVQTFEVPAAVAAAAGPQQETSRFWDRQRLGRGAKLGFQATSGFWRDRSFRSPRGTYLILRENSLLREAVTSLAMRGYGLAWLSQSQTMAADPERERLGRLITTVIEHHLQPLVPKFVWSVVRAVILEDLLEAADRYTGALHWWRTALAQRPRRSLRGVLTNMLMLPETPALFHVCRSVGLPVIGFQHGTAREISQNNQRIEAYFEGNTADYFFTYSPAAAEVSERSPLNSAKCVAVGMPAEFSRCATYRPSRATAPTLLVISSTLYAGHESQMIGSRGLSDLEAAANDVALVEQVLGVVPFRVVFKPYPAVRYCDPDPILVAAARHKNVEVYGGRDDVSFLIPDADIVLSSRATSSIAWGAVSGRPFIFLDHPRDLPLFANARLAFDEAFFVFDRAQPGFHEALRTLLMLPLNEIRRRWADKAARRAQVVAHYFGHVDGRSGKRAADAIVAL